MDAAGCGAGPLRSSLAESLPSCHLPNSHSSPPLMNRTGAPGIKGRSTLPGDGLREWVQSESFRMKNREGAIAIPGAIKWTRVFFLAKKRNGRGLWGPTSRLLVPRKTSTCISPRDPKKDSPTCVSPPTPRFPIEAGRGYRKRPKNGRRLSA